MRSPKWNMPVDTTLPASVQSWLGQQLELRGIDAVIYTRYILSILQQDSHDLEVAESELFPAPAAASKRGTPKESSAGKTLKPKLKARKAEKRGSREVDVEELKKSAAVECLMSVSDEDCDIENLVEELCLRLKEQKLFSQEVAAAEVEDKKLHGEHSDGNDSILSSSPEDPAERYYAAFPPLSDQPKEIKPQAVYQDSCVWAKLVQKSQVSTLSGDDDESSDIQTQDSNCAKSKSDPQESEAAATAQPTSSKPKSGPSVKAKISKLEIKLSKSEKGKKKYSPRGSPNEPRSAKKDKQGQLLQKNAGGQWKKDLEAAAENPTFFVPKVKQPEGKGKSMKFPITSDGKPFEKSDGDEAGCLWLMQMLEENKKAEQALLKESPKPDDHCEDHWIVHEEEDPDDWMLDFNLSSLYGQEDQSWYTKPINDFLAPSPAPSKRLYKRRSDADLETMQTSEDEESDIEASGRTSNKLEALLAQLLSPIEQIEDCTQFDVSEEVEMPILQVSNTSNHGLESPGRETDANCECGNNNNKGETSLCLPLCHRTLYGTLESGVSSPTELASQAIPFSKENEVLDDRPGSIKQFQQLQETLDFLQDKESFTNADADDQQCFSCPSCPSSAPCVNKQSNLLPCASELVTPEPSGAESEQDATKGALSLEWFLPTSAPSELAYTNICDNSYTTSNSHSGVNVMPGEWSMNWDNSETLVTMQAETIWNGDWTATQNWSTNVGNHVSPWNPQSEVFSQIWDINASKRQVDPEICHPYSRERSNTTDRLQRNLLHVEFPAATRKDFIEGGLYGSDWASTGPDISSSDTSLIGISPFSGVEEDKTEDPSWDSFCLKPPQLRQRSTSADETLFGADANTQNGLNKQIPNPEITPSENTAFQDCIPPHMSHLMHVQSEPILSPSKIAQRKAARHETCHRLVQIKHLYKSDTSILKELGLASGSDYEEVDQKTELEISPDRHFKPIIGPSEVTAGLRGDSGQCLEKKSDGARSLSSSSRSTISGYQLYCLDDRLAEEQSSFVPRFKIVVECDKSAQTGEEEEDEEGEGTENKDSLEDERVLTERLLEDMNNMLKLETDDEDECPSFTVEDIVDTPLAASPSQSCDQSITDLSFTLKDKLHETLDALQGKGDELVNLWTEDEESNTESKPEVNKNIWSCGTDMNLPNLPDSSSFSDWTLQKVYGSTWSKGPEAQVHEPFPTGLEDTLPKSAEKTGKLDAEAEEPEWMNVELDDVFFEESLDKDMALFPFETGLPHNSILYSSDLEEQWLSSESQFEVQVPRRKSKPRRGPARKPCSFFMEGSCRRADCKFAHDMSNITCRFWEEGECFKGITCPFLHGYPGENLEESTTLSDFSLEPEDFPELLGTSDDKDQGPTMIFGAEDMPTSASRKLNRLNSSTDKSRSNKRIGQLKSKPKSQPIDIKPRNK